MTPAVEFPEYEAFWREYDRVLDTLAGQDLAKSLEALENEDSQTNRRFYCRALFALIEGHTAMLRAYVLTHSLGLIGEDTELRLRNRRRITEGPKTERTRPSFEKLTDAVFFAHDTFAWTNGCFEFERRTPEGDWRRLERAAALRNRITHPKGARDLRVTKRDLLMLNAVERWFFRRTSKVLRRVEAAINREARAVARVRSTMVQ